MLTNTGATELGRAIQMAAHSFNFSGSSISDGSDALRPATLRGLGPDQTLVLINGKRRHTSALIHVNTSVDRGAAGTDMNAIPISAVKRVEVLRDGLDGTRQYACTDGVNIDYSCTTITTLDPREATFDRRNFRIGDADSAQNSFITKRIFRPRKSHQSESR